MRARGMLGSKSVSTAAVAPQPTSQPEQLPATPGQTALRLLAAFSPQASAAYNQSLVFDFNGPLDTESLQAALHDVCRRHEALRTTFPERSEEHTSELQSLMRI